MGSEMCIRDSLNRVSVWRPQKDAAQTYYITDNTSGQILEIPFVANEDVRVIDPEVMTLTNGRSYTITAPAPEDGEAATVSVNFVVLDEEVSAPDAIASALIENGCNEQLELLTDVLESNVP